MSRGCSVYAWATGREPGPAHQVDEAIGQYPWMQVITQLHAAETNKQKK